uniref:SOWAHA-C winged helix-turn-helix domain-containing protein n=1 Tax=Anabas testudineus TaxID=64144 RepID=A0A3Q1IDA7_ANATE
MAAECSEEAILDYVRSRGGKVRNSDLIEHFKEVFPEEPEKRAVVRESFKKCVDNIAFVKSEDGVKYVCLKKKFRGSVKAQHGSGEAKVTYRQPAASRSGQLDAHSLSGSEGNSSPKCSRQHFIQAMINSSPDVRRSLVLRNSVCLPSRTESDSVFLGSHMDDDRSLVTLEPLEHEWMMCASDGDWSSLYRLLTVDPSLVLRKDFVTGFTCLHWAAKHGKPELIALILNFARQHDIPVSVDVRSSTGYTPLHVAAMHNHMEVVKLLVGAYSANVEIRDYSGRKACQYLTDSVSVDIRDIIGAYEHCDLESTENRRGSRWRLSKVLQSNLKPLRLLSPTDCDSVDRDDQSREKPLRRKSSLSKMKPKLQKLRNRTSQIVHSTSFHETEELSRKGSMKGSFKARPMTHFFG